MTATSGVGDALSGHVRAELEQWSPVLDELGELFVAAGHEISLVGGPVRDALLRRIDARHMDIDLTTSARPEETLAVLDGWADKIWEVGREFGTIACRRRDTIVEITTYRSEKYEPSSRKPSVSFGDSLEGDLVRRDFTVNAMAVKLPTWELVDPYGGAADAMKGVLATPAAAVESFDEDPLRMMRAARFVSVLGFEPNDDVVHAMVDLAERLEIVSVERIQVELVKLICGTYPRRGVELMVDTGIADVFLPEVPKMKETVDEHKRHKDVYEHSLTVMDQAVDLEDAPDASGENAVPGPDFVLRFAALMHDIAKPKTRKFTKGGGVTFHHHEVVGAKMTAKRMKALRFDSATTKSVTKLVELHLRFHGYGESAWTDSAVRRYVTDAGDMLSRLHKLTRADCTTRNRRKAAMLAKRYDGLEQRIAELSQQEELKAIRPDISGEDIMGLLGIKPGPLVGRAYKHMLALRMEQGPMERGEAEAELMRWWGQQPESEAAAE